MKKIFSILLLGLISLMNVSPVLADEEIQNNTQDTTTETSANYNETDTNTQQSRTVLSTSLEDEKVYLLPGNVYRLEFESDFDVNEAQKDDEIYFKLVSPVQASNGMYLPQHTRFVGKLKKLSPSKPLFKRARAYIVIDKILLPNENSYNARLEPQKGSDLKSPQVLNIIRAVPSGIGVITFSAIGAATVAIESVSVVGLVIVPRTCKGFGLLISSMAKGLNYKVKAGKQMEFKINSPVYISVSDLKKCP